jgi:ribosomal protein S27AE
MSQPAETRKPEGEAMLCGRCGDTMALTVVAPSLVPDHDSVTYACTKCGHTLVKDVPYR